VEAASLKLNHLFALWARLPTLGFGNAHGLFDILILWTETIMSLVLFFHLRFPWISLDQEKQCAFLT
jgi:hypothetical protein